MTMMAPQSYVDDLEGESYEQMIKERDKLIREIRHFEKHREEIMNSEEVYIVVFNLAAQLLHFLPDDFP